MTVAIYGQCITPDNEVGRSIRSPSLGMEGSDRSSLAFLIRMGRVSPWSPEQFPRALEILRANEAADTKANDDKETTAAKVAIDKETTTKLAIDKETTAAKVMPPPRRRPRPPSRPPTLERWFKARKVMQTSEMMTKTSETIKVETKTLETAITVENETSETKGKVEDETTALTPHPPAEPPSVDQLVRVWFADTLASLTASMAAEDGEDHPQPEVEWW